jgi:hypothetical protein
MVLKHRWVARAGVMLALAVASISGASVAHPSAHADSVVSQSSATAEPPIPYPPSGTYGVGRKTSGSNVQPALATVSCTWEDWPVVVNGNTVRERVDQTCTGLVAFQSIVLTVVHCDGIFWGCLWHDHPEYGQPSGYKSGPGMVTANGTWNLPSSGNGYYIKAHFHTCDLYDDCADKDGGSPQFFVR